MISYRVINGFIFCLLVVRIYHLTEVQRVQVGMYRIFSKEIYTGEFAHHDEID